MFLAIIESCFQIGKYKQKVMIYGFKRKQNCSRFYNALRESISTRFNDAVVVNRTQEAFTLPERNSFVKLTFLI